MPTKKKNPPKKTRTSKIDVWLSHYINSENQTTFLNKTESARAAGYKGKDDMSLCSIGCQNFNKLNVKINKWLDEVGLSENSLKIKLVNLMEAEETKFLNVKGIINKEDLPDKAQILVTGITTKYTKDGESYDEIDTVIGLNIESKELQRRSLDMAIKVRGLYAAEKRELTGKDGGPIQTNDQGVMDRVDKFFEDLKQKKPEV